MIVGKLANHWLIVVSAIDMLEWFGCVLNIIVLVLAFVVGTFAVLAVVYSSRFDRMLVVLIVAGCFVVPFVARRLIDDSMERIATVPNAFLQVGEEIGRWFCPSYDVELQYIVETNEYIVGWSRIVWFSGQAVLLDIEMHRVRIVLEAVTIVLSVKRPY